MKTKTNPLIAEVQEHIYSLKLIQRRRNEPAVKEDHSQSV